MSRPLLALFAALGLATLANPPSVAFAQSDAAGDNLELQSELPPRPSDAAEPSPHNPLPRFGGQMVEMRLAEAVALGIENNLDLQVDRFDPLIAFEGKETAWGAYDPVWGLEGGYSEALEPNTNALTGSDDTRNSTQVWDANTSIDALIPWWGGSVEFDFGGSRTNTTNFAGFAALKPIYESSASLSLRAPLLRGLVWNEPWTRIKTSATQFASSKEDFVTDLMNIVQFIETGYWDVVASKESVRVAEKSLETAESLLDQTRTEYEVGVKSKVEVVESEAGVASREFDLIVAVNAYWAAQDRLIDAVLGTQLTPGTPLEIVPADDPEAYITYQIDMVEAAEKAFKLRPELKQAEYSVEQQEFELKFAKNQRLPQFDLVGSFGVGGTRGRPRDTGFGGPTRDENQFEGGYRDTYKDWFKGEGARNYGVRGVVSIPIGNIAGRHTVSSRQLELRRAKSLLLRLRQSIILEVREAVRDLESGQEGIEAAERRRLAAAEQLRAERVRLEYGESTPFNVLLREEDLVEAENEKIRALFTYRTSVIDLNRAQGTILQSRNIVVEEAASLR